MFFISGQFSDKWSTLWWQPCFFLVWNDNFFGVSIQIFCVFYSKFSMYFGGFIHSVSSLGFSFVFFCWQWECSNLLVILCQICSEMGKSADFSPRKAGQVKVLLQNSTMMQREIAQELGVSTQSVSLIKKKLEKGLSLENKRVGKCGRKRKTTPRADRKIKTMALKDRRLTCRRISSFLMEERINISRRTVNRRLLECGLKAYRPRKKPRLTVKMKEARLTWAKAHKHWTEYDWSKVFAFFILYYCSYTV